MQSQSSKKLFVTEIIWHIPLETLRHRHIPVGVSNEIEIPASILDAILKETHGKIFKRILVLFQTREISEEIHTQTVRMNHLKFFKGIPG